MKIGREETKPMAERIAIFYDLLDKAPPCRNPQEALFLINRTLEFVENTWSGVPKNPNPSLKPDGRMYAPKSDFIEFLPDGSTKALTRRHEILLSSQGEIKFVHRVTQVVEFRKAGAENANPI